MNISLAKVASIIHGELAKMLVKIHKAVNISARLSLSAAVICRRNRAVHSEGIH
jgi:hypothetical protein